MSYQDSLMVAKVYARKAEEKENNDPIEAVTMYKQALIFCAEAIEVCSSKVGESMVEYQIGIYRNRITQLQTLQKRKIAAPVREVPDSGMVEERRPKDPPYRPKKVDAIDTAPQELMNPPEIEARVHYLINEQREENGLDPLGYDNALASIARAHSRDMARRNFFAHENPDGLSPSDRADRAGYKSFKDHGTYTTNGIAENILQTNLATSVTHINGVPTSYNWRTMDRLVESAVDGWMNSPGHRKNILTATYEKEGIGVVIGPENKVYMTEDFC
ncbi:MAG: CAP domain-containing protein [Candidatus Aenigmatarchaeota archaeon]